MKKRSLALMLALALCLGLAVPAAAADVSGLSASGAQSYYDALNAYGRQDVWVAYADLRDMDGDKAPEMIAMTLPKSDLGLQVLTIDIWQLKNGVAAKTTSIEKDANQECYVRYAAKGGKVYIEACSYFMRQGVYGEDTNYIGPGGFCESLSHWGDNNTGEADEYERSLNGSRVSVTQAQYEQCLKAYTAEQDYVVSGGGLSWGSIWTAGPEPVHDSSYGAVLDLLCAKAAEAPPPAAGTYGTYTIRSGSGEWGWSVTFGQAKVEKATIQYRDKWIVDGKEAVGAYQDRSVTLVTLKPGSSISVSTSAGYSDEGTPNGVQYNLIQDGDGKYTYIVAANMLYGDDFNMAFLSPDGADMKNELKAGPLLICAGRDGYSYYDSYIVAYGSASAPSTPSVPSSTVFSDVSDAAYYAGPVKWAVSKGITNGTGATTFSPEEKCTQAQILTFLWRAAGKPATGGGARPDWVPEAYQEAVFWAASEHMLNIAAFDPDKPCTRSTAVSYIWQAMGRPAPQMVAQFSDVSSSASYAQAVSWAVGAGVTNGTSAATFSPNDTCTRGQIVTFLHRAMGG